MRTGRINGRGQVMKLLGGIAEPEPNYETWTLEDDGSGARTDRQSPSDSQRAARVHSSPDECGRTGWISGDLASASNFATSLEELRPHGTPHVVRPGPIDALEQEVAHPIIGAPGLRIGEESETENGCEDQEMKRI